MKNDVKVFDQRFAAFALIASLHATSACSSRAITGTTVITPDQPVSPPTAPTPSAPGNPQALPPHHETDECAVIAGPGEPLVTVALPDRIDPANAPRPSNDSERLLFRQLYETLVRVDCMGRVRPSLAASWRLDSDGRTWIVTLRDNARFADGTAVTADIVRASWMLDAGGDALRADVGRLVQSVVAVDDRTLAVLLWRPQTEAPIALAHPDLAIARPIAGSSWPVGTRSGRITAVVDGPPGKPAALTITRDDLAPLRFLPASGDPRDFLDAGVDLLLTRDPAALDYARTLSQFQLVPLAWQRTHVLLVPDRSRPLPLQSEQARQQLAADAVRGEARGAQGPFWWRMLADCDVMPTSLRSQSSPAPRIVFDAGDGTARDLAERFVGLGMYERATGLTEQALAQARRLGTDGGYLMSVDNRPVDPCRDLHVLMDAAPWLQPETIVPLIETRLQAILRRGRSGISAEWDGGIAIAGDIDKPNQPPPRLRRSAEASAKAEGLSPQKHQ